MPSTTDLTSPGEYDDPNGLIVQYTAPINAGTGNYDTFLSIQSNTTTESGFNHDIPPVIDDEGQGNHTHALQIGNIGTAVVNGVTYYVFRLDVNEPNTAPDQVVTLTNLTFFGSTSQATVDPTVNGSGFTQILSLDDPLTLTDHSSGSGTDDYLIFLPKDAVDNALPGDNSADFLTVFATFDGVDGGFEEFRALPGTPGVVTEAAAIGIVKDTLVFDTSVAQTLADNVSVEGKTVLAGTQLVWTYTVANGGNVAIPGSDITVTDDHLGVTPTPVLQGDGIHNIGDTNDDGKLDVTEQWVFVAGVDTSGGTAAIDGAYTNVGTANGTFDAGGPNETTLFAQDNSGYNGVAPAIHVDKTTSGIDPLGNPVGPGDGIVVGEGTTVTWHYTVTNTGDAPLSDVVVVDDNGTPGVANDGDDFLATAVTGIDGVHNIGDTNNDGILETTETWQFTASGPALTGVAYSNIATASGDFTDDIGQSDTVTATDGSSYTAFTPRTGELTIGYWYNHDTSKSGGGAEGQWTPFLVSNPAGAPVGGDSHNLYLLLGDENGDKIIDNGETGLYIAFDAAKELINSSQTANDTRQILLSQAIATQLNIDKLALADGHAHSVYSPNGLITDAVKWLNGTDTFADGSTGNVDGNHDGFITAGSGATADYFNGSKPHHLTADANLTVSGVQVLTSSSDAWNDVSIVFNSANNGPFTEDGEAIKNALMYYNQAQLVPDITGQFVEWTATSNITTNGVNDFWQIIP